MKTTAKPTPGPVEVSDTSVVSGECCIAVIEDDGGYEAPPEEREANALLIADAFNIYHETGLSPREILAQRDELLERLDTLTLVVGLTPISGNKEALQEAMNAARAAIQNASKGGEKEPLDIFATRGIVGDGTKTSDELLDRA